jgi:hypothetical protein
MPYAVSLAERAAFDDREVEAWRTGDMEKARVAE